MSQPTQSAGRRLSVITIDQALAGASNVLVTLLAARMLAVADFGLFGIVFLVYVVAQCVDRALVGDPLLLHPVEATQRRADVLGTGALLGLGLGALVVLAGVIARLWVTDLGTPLIVLGACMPLLVMQDLGRYVGFARHRPGAALGLDATWLVLVVLAVVGLIVEREHSLSWFVVAWAGTGALSGLVTLAQHRDVGLRLGLAWLRETWGYSWKYLLSYTSTQGSALAGSSAVGAIAGARALGAMQGAFLLVRPYLTFQTAATASGVTDIARLEDGDRALRVHVGRISALTLTVAVLNGIVLLVLPDAAGRALLGATWSAAQPLLLPAAAHIVLLGLATGPRAGLLGVRELRKAVPIDVAGTVVVLGATIIGALLDGVLGAMWARAICWVGIAVAWWVVWLRHRRTLGGPPDVEAVSLGAAGGPAGGRP